MNVSIGEHWEAFVDELVRSGRFGSASEVIRHGLRRVEAEEAQLQALKNSLAATIAEDVWYSADEVVDYVNSTLHEDAPDFTPKK